MGHVEVDREEVVFVDGSVVVTIRCSCDFAQKGTGPNHEFAGAEVAAAFATHRDQGQ